MAQLISMAIIVLAVVNLVLIMFTFGSKDRGVQAIKFLLTIALFVLNILVGDVIFAILWGIAVLVYIFVMAFPPR